MAINVEDSRFLRLSSRGVAQPGSAPALGAGSRRFESCRPDHFLSLKFPSILG